MSERRNFATGFIVVMLSSWSREGPPVSFSSCKKTGPNSGQMGWAQKSTAPEKRVPLKEMAWGCMDPAHENSQAVKQKCQAWQFVDKQGEPSGIWGAGCKPYNKNTVVLRTENDSPLLADRKTLQCMFFFSDLKTNLPYVESTMELKWSNCRWFDRWKGWISNPSR